MGTQYKSQIDGEKRTYKIQFETTDWEYYRTVERVCQKVIDISCRTENMIIPNSKIDSSKFIDSKAISKGYLSDSQILQAKITGLEDD